MAVAIGLICAACNAPIAPSPAAAVASVVATPETSPTTASLIPSPATGLKSPSSSGSPPPPCAAEQLALAVGRMGAAAGTFYARLSLDRRNGPPCSIQASPKVEIVDRLGVVIAQDPAFGIDRVVVDRTLATELGWSSWCDPPPSRPLELRITSQPASVVLLATLPNGFGASCMDVATRAFLNRPFSPD
jgi:hypothetical protein